MKKLRRESAGFYYVESWGSLGETLHIYKIERKLWGYCIGKSMTKGTAETLRELKNKLGIK